MLEDMAGAAVRSISQIHGEHLSDDDIRKLNISDFLAYLGKRMTIPGGIDGLNRMLEMRQPRPGFMYL